MLASLYYMSNYSTEDDVKLHQLVMTASIFKSALEKATAAKENLTPQQLTVPSNHANLGYFITTKKFSKRQARWAEMLNTFNFIIEHRPGIETPQMRPVVGPTTRGEYKNIQSYLPYITSCVWVYSVPRSKINEPAPEFTAHTHCTDS
jgi:hypothetical protein